MKRVNHQYIQGVLHMDVHLPWPTGAPPYFGPWMNDDEVHQQVVAPALESFDPGLGEFLREAGIGRNAAGDPVVIAHLTYDPIDWLVDSLNFELEESNLELQRVGHDSFALEIRSSLTQDARFRKTSLAEVRRLHALAEKDDDEGDAFIDALNKLTATAPQEDI